MTIQNYILEQNKVDYQEFKNNITRSRFLLYSPL